MRYTRHSVSGLAAGLILLAGVWLVLAQPSGKRAGEEAPRGAKAPVNPKRTEEEEEDGKRAPSKTIQDPDRVAPAVPRSRPAEPQAVDLAQAARSARHPAVRELFQTLAFPHDLATFHGTVTRTALIQPVPQLVRDKAGKLLRNQDLVPLDKEGSVLIDPRAKDKPQVLKVTGDTRIQPYEELALEEVNRFLAQNYSKLPESDPRYLSRLDQLIAAEQVLGFVARYHESARQRKERDGDGWLEVEGRLQRESKHDPRHLLGLREVLLLQLQELVEGGNWDAALTLGRRLYETFPLLEDRERIALPLAKLLRSALKDPLASREKMREVRQKLAEMEARYPNNAVFQAISGELKQQAEELVRLADRIRSQTDLPDTVRFQRAQELLYQAEEIWPQLPELRAKRQEANQTYPILNVGVRRLPDRMSPGWAVTDSDLRAVELLFESLVKVCPDAEGNQRFGPGLAQGRPQTVSLGRLFQLPRNAAWSNNKPLTSSDVRYTVRQLKAGVGTGRGPAWGDLLDEEVANDDPLRVSVNLKQGYLEPLALMTFKILPHPSQLERDKAADTEEFARKPIGSGPFVYKGRTVMAGGRTYAAFLTNLEYGSRPDKFGRPRIREVRLIPYLVDPDNPLKVIEDLQNLRLDLMLDLTAEQASQLKKQAGELKLTVPPPLPGNRRVYFLAVNNENRHLKSPLLRRALAHAINREQVLDVVFRGALQRTVHQALNSPFPAKSWPLHPGIRNRDNKDSLDLFSPDDARALMAQFRKENNDPAVKLTLKYPDGDEAVQKAVEAIRNMVRDSTGVQLELEKVDPYRLRKDVEGPPHRYDLAYYHYDFPDDTFWLGPLLGRRALPNGNYLNYHNAALETQLLRIRALRDFAQVRKKLQEIHEILVQQEMPLIPLWQLDPLLAIHDDLKAPPFDPWLVFTEIDQWRLELRK